MSKLNAAGAAMMVLKVSSILKTANEAVLVAVRDDLNAQIAEWQEKRQAKVGGKTLVASASIDPGFARPVTYPTADMLQAQDRPELHQAEGQS